MQTCILYRCTSVCGSNESSFWFFLSLVTSVVQAMRCFYVMIFELDFSILTKNVPAQVQFICQLLVNIYVLLTNISANNYFLMAVSV